MKKIHAKPRFSTNSSGVTLMEIMIVVTLIVVLAILAIISFRIQITRGYDAKRKSDLTRIRNAFEEYYNDHQCYPDLSILSVCGGNGLAPYIDQIPCDPTTGETYFYNADDGGASDPCNGYRICAALKDTKDPDIASMGCSALWGCGWGEQFNYCLAQGISVTPDGFDPGATPTPTATPIPGNFACTPNGTCNNYGASSAQKGCPFTYSNPQCDNACGNPDNRCDE